MKRCVAFLALVLSLTGAAWAANDALSPEANQAYLAANAQKKGVIVRPSGLQFRIIQNGFGKHPGPTDTVTIYYTGKMINGATFDGTSPGLPAFLPVKNVIPGWKEALQVMREGDHWELVVPANLGYGDRGSPDGGIPPNQTLVFDMRLITTTPAPKRGEPGYRPDPHDKDDDQQQ
jgi:FKBP-type peptidyl-prolyl cis-trans isomerase